ncbi:MAG: hydrolase [Rhodobacteraceae bacterium]|nr:MAG: hydrolase [Paracoccaceae bacterium]
MTTIDARWLLPGPEARASAHQRITLTGGQVGSVSSGPSGAGGGLVLPPIANAHDHARLARLSQVDSYDVPLEAWLPYLALIPSVDPYLASTVAFGRSAMGGAGAVMAHYTRVQGLTDFPTEAREVARAARDVGLHLGFAIHCRDRNPLVYGGQAQLLEALGAEHAETVKRRFLKPYLPAAEQVAMVEAVAAEIEGDGVTVQYGPAGVQWCSDALLEMIAANSAKHGRRVHMHLLETRYQRDWADQTYPEGIVTHLDRIGLLNDRVSFAHCIYLRPDEMELIAERGATIVTNPSSNLIVSSGVAPVGEMLRRGCRVAMGLDGLAFDEDEDALREMRLGYALHKARGFERFMSRDQLIRMVGANGFFAITGRKDGGVIAPGGPADLLELDWDALAAELIDPDTAPLSLLLAKGTKAHVRNLTVAGRQVVADGRLAAFDLAENESQLLEAMRRAWPQTHDIRRAMPDLVANLARHHVEGLHCCC